MTWKESVLGGGLVFPACDGKIRVSSDYSISRSSSLALAASLMQNSPKCSSVHLMHSLWVIPCLMLVRGKTAPPHLNSTKAAPVPEKSCLKTVWREAEGNDGEQIGLLCIT